MEIVCATFPTATPQPSNCRYKFLYNRHRPRSWHRSCYRRTVLLYIYIHISESNSWNNLFIEPSQVEFVLNVVLVDFAKEFVAAEAAEPGDPTNFFWTAHFGLKKNTILVTIYTMDRKINIIILAHTRESPKMFNKS